MNILEDYAKEIFSVIADDFWCSHNIYYDFSDSGEPFGRNMVPYFDQYISPILKTGEIPHEKGAGFYYTIALYRERDIPFIIKNIFLNKNISTKMVQHIIWSTIGLKRNDILREKISFRDEVFNMSDEEYLLWRMSI